MFTKTQSTPKNAAVFSVRMRADVTDRKYESTEALNITSRFRALVAWDRAHYRSVTKAPHMTDFLWVDETAHYAPYL